jgi:hypothetical protein
VVFYLFFEGCHILCISGCMFFPFLGISYAWSGLSINLAISKKKMYNLENCFLSLIHVFSL